MIRLLLLAVLAYFAFRFIRNYLRTANSEQFNCDYCHQYFPKAQLVYTRGKFFCCLEHAKADENQS